jgi:hypothetical protein
MGLQEMAGRPMVSGQQGNRGHGHDGDHRGLQDLIDSRHMRPPAVCPQYLRRWFASAVDGAQIRRRSDRVL